MCKTNCMKVSIIPTHACHGARHLQNNINHRLSWSSTDSSSLHAGLWHLAEKWQDLVDGPKNGRPKSLGSFRAPPRDRVWTVLGVLRSTHSATYSSWLILFLICIYFYYCVHFPAVVHLSQRQDLPEMCQIV